MSTPATTPEDEDSMEIDESGASKKVGGLVLAVKCSSINHSTSKRVTESEAISLFALYPKNLQVTHFLKFVTLPNIFYGFMKKK